MYATADAVPSMTEPTPAEEAQQIADPRDVNGPGDTADTHASISPRDCHTPKKSSSKKRIGAGDGSLKSVEEDEQHSKRMKTCSQSQTDRATVQACGEVGSQRKKSSGQSGSNGQDNGQPKGQHNGQSKGQRNGQSQGQHNGQHKPDGHSNAHHSKRSQVDGQSSGQHNGELENDGQSNGHVEATDMKQPNGSAQPISRVSPHADCESDSMSDSSLEDEEEAADLKLESLGNIDIATADSQVLSLGMLQGLKAGLKARLSLYATDTTDGDVEQLREVQEARARWDSSHALPCPALCLSVPCCIC